MGWLVVAAARVTGGEAEQARADRTAVERVYYDHRLGTKPPFEQAVPPAMVERLVAADEHKEAVLRRVYGVVIPPAQVEAEVRRITVSSQAPAVLAELKAALGGDPERFARAVARPLVVERELRGRYDNDDARHAAVRAVAEQARAGARAARTNGYAVQLVALRRAATNELAETVWELGARPAGKAKPGATPDAAEIQQRFGPEARLLTSPDAEAGAGERKFYFAELPAELQRVLNVQLRAAGDVSAVIETPTGFLLYVARSRTEAQLAVAVLSLPKLDYETWVAGQP